MCAALEYRGQVISQRFDLPPELIYLTSILHVFCALGVLIRPFAIWAAAGLVLITLGATGAHFRIGSPLTALPAILYSALQIWFGLNCRRSTPAGD